MPDAVAAQYAGYGIDTSISAFASDGWADASTAQTKWYCSQADSSNWGKTYDATMAAYVLTGGVGYDSAANSNTGGACCAANTFATWTQQCSCLSTTIATAHYSKTVGTATDDSNLGCVSCGTIDGAKSSTTYNGVELEHFLTTASSASSCAFNDVSFKMISTSTTDFRCLTVVDPATSQTTGHYSMKCDDPSDETTCKASLTCLDCASVATATSGFKYGSVAGSCGCTASCNDDDSCATGAILNNVNQCECLYDNVPGIDSSLVETCQAVNIHFCRWF